MPDKNTAGQAKHTPYREDIVVDDDASVQHWLNTDTQPKRTLFEAHYARLVQIRHADRKDIGWRRHIIATFVQTVGVLGAGYFGPMEVKHAWWLTLSIWAFRLADLAMQILPALTRSVYFNEIDTAMTRFAELLRESKPLDHESDYVARDRNNHAITALLSLMESHVRHLVNVPHGKITVTFARYIENNERLDMTMRNRGSLRAMTQVHAENYILGHRVCQTTKQVRTVHDLHHFPDIYRRSPTGNDAKYRSFMIFPVREKHPDDGPCIGFLSIDCEIPYAFYGKRAKLIVATIGPILKQIAQRSASTEELT